MTDSSAKQASRMIAPGLPTRLAQIVTCYFSLLQVAEYEHMSEPMTAVLFRPLRPCYLHPYSTSPFWVAAAPPSIGAQHPYFPRRRARGS